MIRLMCFESEPKKKENCYSIAEKLDLKYLPCTNPVWFPDAVPFDSSWVNAMDGAATDQATTNIQLMQQDITSSYLNILKEKFTECISHLPQIKCHKRT